MTGLLSKLSAKLYFKQWIIGFCNGDLGDIIRTGTFRQDIKWLHAGRFNRFYADPFFVPSSDNNLKVLFEDYPFDDDYGKIVLMTLDNKLGLISEKPVLDTGSHLSYPFLYFEDNRIFMFPEASKSGKLSCYEYDPVKESVGFLKDIIDLPLKDASIIKIGDKYWLMGIIPVGETDYKLHLFHSASLLGPYTPHRKNPVRSGLDGTRPAGNFILVDGTLYRPAQNCSKGYGESMVINRIIEISEDNLVEEPCMKISIDRSIRSNRKVHSMHTINQTGKILVVDGEQWTFAPWKQLKKFAGDLYFVRKLNRTKS
jgi:hypothetical protein